MKLKKLIKKFAAPLLAEAGFVPTRTRRRSSNRRLRFCDVVGPWNDKTGNGRSAQDVRELVRRAKEQADGLHEGGPDQVRMADRIEEQARRICCEHLAAKSVSALVDGEMWEAYIDVSFGSRAQYFEFLRKIAEGFKVVENFTIGEGDGYVKGRVIVEVNTTRRGSLHGAALTLCEDPRISFSLKEYRV